jgi:ABC-type Na+ efflux pump permease subunit
VALSLIPLTSPVAMATRMVQTTVPFWQLALGLAALAVTAYGLVALAGRLFRADNLLSTASLDVQRLLRELKA